MKPVPTYHVAIQATVIIYVFSSVMPVKTGIQASLHARHWTPASAGVTVIWGSSMLRKIMPVRGICRTIVGLGHQAHST